jgi:hypothetical protein
MRLRRIVAVLLVASLMVAPLAIADQGRPAVPKICAAPGVNPRLIAHIPNVQSARMYFNAEPSGPEYYVDMHRGAGDTWWAILPLVEVSTKAITYRAAVPDGNKGWSRGPAVTVATTTACPPTQMTAAEVEAANNIVIGLTNPGESPVPVGFLCRGIKAVVDANGQLRPADECRTLLASGAAGAAGATAAASSGIHAAVIAAAAVGGAALGYAAGHNNKNNNPVSPSRP